MDEDEPKEGYCVSETRDKSRRDTGRRRMNRREGKGDETGRVRERKSERRERGERGREGGERGEKGESER